MTNWDKMRRVVSVSKDYIIENYVKVLKANCFPYRVIILVVINVYLI